MKTRKHSQHRSQRRSRNHSRDRAQHGGERHRRQVMKFKATVDKNWRGFAFLIFEKRHLHDAFVSPDRARELFHGDRVEATMDFVGRIVKIEILEHRFREIVGRFVSERKRPEKGKHLRSGFIVYERKRAREEIYVPSCSVKVGENEWVRAKLHFHRNKRPGVTGEILEVYGDQIPASKDVWLIAAEYNLIETHSAEAEAEARSFGNVVRPADLKGRDDLLALPFITIDSETARDFDDAIYVERTEDGYDLWVAIADVSHYVKENTALDGEARSRGTSVYFPERAFHMLPRALSENLCSLRPNEPRLALTARMSFDPEGHRRATSILEAVIQSRRRATYNEIQAEWVKEKDNPDWEYSPHLELYQILRNVRKNRGSLDFELPEAEVLVDSQGEVLNITNRPRLESHRIIEEFMIAANEAVTAWMMTRKYPFIYRVHEEPSLEALQRFQALAAAVGVETTLEKLGSPRAVSQMLLNLEEHPAQALLNMALLRSLKQAVYSSVHGIHFGLASTAYTHFTSPIRRYPDLAVHRLIKMVLNPASHAKMKNKKYIAALEEELAQISEHCSYRERLAADAEREAIRIKQVRLMSHQLGNEYDGKIVGMIESGFFVQLTAPFVEGMVPIETLMGDMYRFDEDRMVMIGQRTKVMFRIGDGVRVKLVRVDMDRREIEFQILDHQGFSKGMKKNEMVKNRAPTRPSR